MKLIIDIDNDVYNECQGHIYFPDTGGELFNAVKNGAPLPKGHGRLIDADAYRKEMFDSREFNFFKTLDMQPTIIEADTESESE